MAKITSDILHDVHDHSIDVKNRIIYLHDQRAENPHDNDAGIDDRVANKFIKNINLLSMDNKDPVTIYLASIGGHVEYGLSIFDAIKSSECHITCIGHGVVASIATIILQAADKRCLYPNTEFLVHDMSVAFAGKRQEVISHINESQQKYIRMIDIYVDKMKNGPIFSGKNDSYIKKYLMRKLSQTPEIYFSANDALSHGLIDEII